MDTVASRTLRREYRVQAPTGLCEALRFIETVPNLPGIELEPVDVAVTACGGFWRADLPYIGVVEGTASHLIGALHRVFMLDLVEGEPEAALLHGASVLVVGRRLLIAAPKGAGKSTLALHLLLRGHAVEGDEHLLVRHSDVIARPRTLRLKPGTLSLVQGVSDAIRQAPFVDNWDGSPIFSVSPKVNGQDWVIRPGRLDGIVFLAANHGGRSAPKRLGPDETFRRLMGEVLMPARGVPAAAGRLRQLATTVPAYQLLLGDLTVAEWHLANIARLLT